MVQLSPVDSGTFERNRRATILQDPVFQPVQFAAGRTETGLPQIVIRVADSCHEHVTMNINTASLIQTRSQRYHYLKGVVWALVRPCRPASYTHSIVHLYLRLVPRARFLDDLPGSAPNRPSRPHKTKTVFHHLIPDQDPGHPATLGENSASACLNIAYIHGQEGRIERGFGLEVRQFKKSRAE